MSDGRDEPSDAPITPELLADLRAGLLDEATASRIRDRLHTDPDAVRTLAALERAGRELTRLGTDTASAPEPPAEVTARVRTALRGAGQPGHSARPPVRWRRWAAIAGVCAAVLAVVVGVVTSARPAARSSSAVITARQITVPRSAPPPALSPADVRDLLRRPPDYGPLGNPTRRAACLSALGLPPDAGVLGASPTQHAGVDAVLLLVADADPATLRAVVVEPNCNALHSGLLADTRVPRP